MSTIAENGKTSLLLSAIKEIPNDMLQKCELLGLAQRLKVQFRLFMLLFSREEKEIKERYIMYALNTMLI
jgi:hypothetical protein